MKRQGSGADQGAAQGDIPIRGGVFLLASVATVSLVVIAAIAGAAATGAEGLFNLLAWLIPLIGVILSLALVGVGVVRGMINNQDSGAQQEGTAQAVQETAQVALSEIQEVKETAQVALSEIQKVTEAADAALSRTEAVQHTTEAVQETAQAALSEIQEVKETAQVALSEIQEVKETARAAAEDIAGEGTDQAGGAQEFAGWVADEVGVGQAAQQAQDTAGEDLNFTHAARRKAEELGLDLSQVEGTGAEGRITLRDVTRAANE